MSLLHQHATASTLARLRIGVFGLWFFIILFDPFPDLAEYITDLFRPPGVLKLVPGPAWDLLFTPVGLWTVKGALLITLAGAAAGWRFRCCAVAATLLLIYQQGLVRGFTYMYHEEMPLLYAAALLVLFPADDALSFGRAAAPGRDPRVYAAGMLSVAAMLCMCFFFTGIHRCVAGGWAVFAGESLRTWVLRNAALSSYPWAGLGPALVSYDAVYAALRGGLILVTVLEVTAPFLLVSRTFRRIGVPGLLLFLVLNALLLNVVFWETALLLAVLVDRAPNQGRNTMTPSTNYR
jgi:hypothetical protein